MKQIDRKINIIILAILLIAISTSCISTRSLTIEIPRKSKKDLPDSIQSLTIISRVINDKYNNLSKDSLQNTFYKKQFQLDTIINDVQSVDTTLKAVGELLFESERFDFVIPENRFLAFKENAFLSEEMPWSEVEEICQLYNTDAVLSFDHFKTQVSTSFDKESLFDPTTSGFYSAVSAEMAVYYEALFRVYDPVAKQVILREFVRDTISWRDVNLSTRELFKNFTPVKTALTEAGIAVALDFTERISTTWRQENRKYFIKGNSKFKSASVFAKDGDWENAMAIWKDIEENNNSKTIKSKAQLNIALVYEITGDIRNAIIWALKSYETMYRPLTYEYLEILKRRNLEIKNQLK